MEEGRSEEPPHLIVRQWVYYEFAKGDFVSLSEDRLDLGEGRLRIPEGEDSTTFHIFEGAFSLHVSYAVLEDGRLARIRIAPRLDRIPFYRTVRAFGPLVEWMDKRLELFARA